MAVLNEDSARDQREAMRRPGMGNGDRSHDERDAGAGRAAEQIRLLNRVLSSITDFAYVFDLDGRFAFINKPLLDLWGLTLDEAVGKNFFDLKYPDDLAAKLQRQIQEVIETRRQLVDETPYTSPTGAGGYYQYIFMPVFGADGRVEAVAGSTRDITRYKRLEAERESLIRTVEGERTTLASIIRQAPAFICVLRGPEHVVELANELYYELAGRSDIVGKPVREAFPDVEGQGYFELLDQVYQTGQTVTGTERPLLLSRRADGLFELRYINFVYQAMRDSGGRISGVFVHGVDMTDSVVSREALREREERLRTSEERLAFALDAAELGTFFCPMPLGEIVWNAKCKEHFWLPADAVVNFDVFYSLIHPEDREGTRAAVEKAVYSREPYDVQYRAVAPDGRVRWVRAKGRAYYDAAGEPTRFDGVTIDVTEQKRVEQTLREATARAERNAAEIEALVESMPHGVYFGNEGGITRCNLLGLRQLGAASLADLQANIVALRNRFRVSYRDDPDRLVTQEDLPFVRALRGNAAWLDTWVTKLDGGERVCVRGTAAPVYEAGQIVGAVAVNTDITEQVRAEEQVRAARDEAERANRAKDRFLAVLSHELRTPLSPVLMTIPAIESDPVLPQKFRDDLAMMRRNIELEVKLIDDLLDLSRVSSGKLALHPQPVDVHELLRHALHNSLSGAPGRQLEIREAFEAAEFRLTGDPARLQQVFWNLLRNAVKFTPDGGTIRVRTWNESGALAVEVSDTGVGILPENLSRIFDAFEQGETRVTRQFGGLGLGLAIAKAVVEMHGGTVEACSGGENQGSAFLVRLPVDQVGSVPPAPLQGVAHLGRQASGPARVLLVEDHPDTGRIMERLLQGAGFSVTLVRSVAGALQAVESAEFDVMISDIGLPDATGYELMQRVRERGLTGIALSGYGMEEDLRRSREAGFAEHIVKPINVAQLEAALRRAMERGGG